ncbi:MAG TPA: hypothetical protein VNM67_17135 [Thermoanaerobaculia bacterium]|jgi:hypothetical protein|nr:hypothetical protein [Thermoanaerobaculia bacterium]
MNIQEFSHQLEEEEQSSQLIRALRELRGLDVELLRRSRRIVPDWGVWNGDGPRACAQRPEPV